MVKNDNKKENVHQWISIGLYHYFTWNKKSKIRRKYSPHYNKADNLEENTGKCRTWLFRIYWYEKAGKWKTWNYGMHENMEEYLQWHIHRLGKETYWEEIKYSEMKLKLNCKVIKKKKETLGNTSTPSCQRHSTNRIMTIFAVYLNFLTPGTSFIKVNLIVQCLKPWTVKERDWNNNMNTWQKKCSGYTHWVSMVSDCLLVVCLINELGMVFCPALPYRPYYITQNIKHNGQDKHKTRVTQTLMHYCTEVSIMTYWHTTKFLTQRMIIY